MKKIKKIAITLSALLTMACIPATNASATFYSHSYSRGINLLTYCQTDFFWETGWRYDIKSSSAYQWSSGVQMEPTGATRVYTNPLEHDWYVTCKAKFGFDVFHYSVAYADKYALSNSGSSWRIK